MKTWKQRAQEHKLQGTVDERAEGGDFKPIPVCTMVDLRIADVEEKETSRGGTQVKFTFEVVEPTQFKNRKIWHNVNVYCPVDDPQKQKNIELRAKDEMLDISKAVGMKDLVENLRDLVGGTVHSEVYEHSEWNGKTYEKLRDFEASSAQSLASTFSDEEIPF